MLIGVEGGENVFIGSDGRFVQPLYESEVPQDTRSLKDSRAVAAGDWNEDGFEDVYVGNYQTQNELLLGDGTGVLAAAQGLNNATATAWATVAVVSADFDGVS